MAYPAGLLPLWASLLQVGTGLPQGCLCVTLDERGRATGNGRALMTTAMQYREPRKAGQQRKSVEMPKRLRVRC